ncbi:MAG: GNAT family N-acetyltransferase [Cyanobacteriota bacterium]|nr:GNAT family N-acetyltransferase [Cyanobacteriota bacterium]
MVLHGPGAWQLRLGQLGPLQRLLDEHSFWAGGRSRHHLGRMLAASQAAVSAWQGSQLVGFGRASSDGVFRATLWDVVVAEEQRGRGLGRRLVQRLLEAPALRQVERVYLMTSKGSAFYQRLGFEPVHGQTLMRLDRDPTESVSRKPGPWAGAGTQQAME